MKEETRLNVNTAIHGLMYAAELIDQALLGEKRHLDARKSESEGPFAITLSSIAEIADGAPIEDRDKAQADLQFLWEQIHHLKGGFYSALWDILARAHVKIAELITVEEAKSVLGDQAFWLSLDGRLGHLHPLVKGENDLSFRTYDSTYLGDPDDYEEVCYAKHEIEESKRRHDAQRSAAKVK